MNTTSVLWQKNPALAWREIDDATVIISPSESVMHELNDTGSFLWKNIDGHKSAEDLAALLAENYEVAPDTALTDTQSLLEEMSSRKLLVPVPATGGEPR
jgi:coenzyme PQQ synthesis protein D (PqqD)